MRPINLKISGFGPYAGTTEIDFEKLGANGLYLITGTTGAGKTTIFDAIAYALYGEPTGENRKVSMLRSTYADAATPTEVELTFRYRGQEYKIRRNPEYMRPKKSGDGFTKETAKQELYCPGRDPITKQKEVDDAIREIIGIDGNQFAQIAMIAQGEFRKLLKAGTEQRSAIFRNVFKTERYQRLQERLKEEYRRIFNAHEEGRRSIDQYIAGVRTADGSGLVALPQLEDTLSQIEEIIGADGEKTKALAEELSGVEEALVQVNAQLKTARELQKDRESLAKAQADFNLESQKQTILEGDLEAARLREPELESKKREISAIDSQLPQYAKLSELYTSISSLEQAMERDRGTLLKTKTELTVAAEQLTVLQKEFGELAPAATMKIKLETEREKVSSQKKELTELFAELSQIEKQQAGLETAQRYYAVDKTAYQEAQQIYDRKYKSYLDQQAGVLAQTLTEGTPCPVCGSAHHPNPAAATVDSPTKEELEKYKADAEQARTKLEASSKAAGDLQIALGQQLLQVQKKLKTLLGHETLETAGEEIRIQLENLTQSVQQLDSQIQAAEANIRRREDLEKRLIPTKEQAHKAADQSIRETENRISRNTATLTEQRKQYAALQGTLSYGSEAAALQARNTLLTQCEAIQKSIKTADTAVQNGKVLLASLQGQIEALSARLKDKQEPDIIGLTRQSGELADKKAVLTEEDKALHSRLDANQSALTHIRSGAAELTELNRRMAWIGSLNQTANGDLKGKEKIKLETYVQMTRFDQVLARANQRLRIMSGGQYELVRKQVAADVRSQSGLDIDVKDYYNGTLRDAASLSGGESFMASLSLALGLSDEIQASASGVQIDTMFVDEGFGSLDDGTLQLAMKALNSLAQDNRLVGIISHVAELKEKIDKQVVVTKQPTGGSRVEIVV